MKENITPLLCELPTRKLEILDLETQLIKKDREIKVLRSMLNSAQQKALCSPQRYQNTFQDQQVHFSAGQKDFPSPSWKPSEQISEKSINFTDNGSLLAQNLLKYDDWRGLRNFTDDRFAKNSQEVNQKDIKDGYRYVDSVKYDTRRVHTLPTEARGLDSYHSQQEGRRSKSRTRMRSKSRPRDKSRARSKHRDYTPDKYQTNDLESNKVASFVISSHNDQFQKVCDEHYHYKQLVEQQIQVAPGDGLTIDLVPQSPITI